MVLKSIGEITFITDRAKGEYTDLDVFNELMVQVDGEREAIDDYTKAMEYIDSTSLESEKKEMLKAILKEIIGDEEKHIGTLTRAITLLKDEFGENFYEGMQEAEETTSEKSDGSECPPGQHQHAGISGCHDIMRKHPFDDGEVAESTEDISQMPTKKLRDAIITTSLMLSQYPAEQVEQFIESPAGKRYIEMYIRYMRSGKASDNTESKKMSEIEETVMESKDEVKACKAEEEVLKEAIPEAEEPKTEMPETAAVTGSIPEGDPKTEMPESPDQEAIPEDGIELKSDMDLPTAITNIASAIVFMKSKIETICARLEGLEDMMRMEAEKKETVPEAIMSDVMEDEAVEEDIEEVSPEKEESDAKSEDKIDVEVKESDEDEKAEEPKEEVKDEDEDKVEVEEESKDDDKDEDKVEVESKTEDKEPEEPKKDDKEDEKKKSYDTFDSFLERSDALTRRTEELRMKGIDMSLLQGNSVSITSDAGRIKSDGPTISIVDTPAPAPYAPAMTSGTTAGFNTWIDDMQSMTPKQFSEKIKGAIRQ